jgi:activator of HSP90 ATPase
LDIEVDGVVRYERKEDVRVLSRISTKGDISISKLGRSSISIFLLKVMRILISSSSAGN